MATRQGEKYREALRWRFENSSAEREALLSAPGKPVTVDELMEMARLAGERHAEFSAWIKPRMTQERALRVRQLRVDEDSRSARIVEQRGRVLPKKLHVKYEWNNADPWLEAAEEIEQLAEKGETVYVGEYRLVKVRKVNLALKVA